MLAEDAEALCGPRHARSAERRAHRWGAANSELAWQGGKIKVARPRVRDLSGKEMKLASWQALSDPDPPRAWAMNPTVLNVSTREYRRAVRLPAGDPPAVKGDATSKSAVSRRACLCFFNREWDIPTRRAASGQSCRSITVSFRSLTISRNLICGEAEKQPKRPFNPPPSLLVGNNHRGS